jgi:23S rRNA (guanosine2251-2'-O)-methyltransferase
MRRRLHPKAFQAASLGGEQVEGRQAVRALLEAKRRRVKEVFLATTTAPSPSLENIVALAASAGVPLRRVRPEVIATMARSEVPQGVVALAEPLQAVDLDELCGPGAFLVVLDGVTDPHNLGAVLRSACAAGAHGVVLSRRRSAHLGPAALKAAAGAAEHLAFALVPGVPAALERLGKAGVWRVGLDEDGPVELEAVSVLAEPVALVLGAEDRGLSRLGATRCDVLARIPMVGPIPSLNVAAAAAIACFTVARRRRC